MHYVIGDVHGCYNELRRLLNIIESQDPKAIIFFVGDWIDYGPQVVDVMKWVVDNISLTGKYRSVRGDHEQEALKWYKESFLPWIKEDHSLEDSFPKTNYDFSEVVNKYFRKNPQELEAFFNKVETAMPYNIPIEITTVGGSLSTYRICHAWHSYESGENTRADNLYGWNFWGNSLSSEIIVHGHTPTISEDYRLRGIRAEDLPGMIGYRHFAINLDGGCCFYKYHPEYPCMLCGICLETLEEFYPFSLEERMLENAKIEIDEYSAILETLSDDEKIQIIYRNRMKPLMAIKPNGYRAEMLKKIAEPKVVLLDE